MIGTFAGLGEDIKGTDIDGAEVIFYVYNACVVIIVIYNIIRTAGNKYTAYEVAKMNLTIKAWQIPAYVLHFLMFICGLLMGIWGIAVWMVALIVDVLTIGLSGANAIGCAIRMKRAGVINSVCAVLMAICSFIFCVDIIIAVVYVILGKKHNMKMVEA